MLVFKKNNKIGGYAFQWQDGTFTAKIDGPFEANLAGDQNWRLNNSGKGATPVIRFIDPHHPYIKKMCGKLHSIWIRQLSPNLQKHPRYRSESTYIWGPTTKSTRHHKFATIFRFVETDRRKQAERDKQAYLPNTFEPLLLQVEKMRNELRSKK